MMKEKIVPQNKMTEIIKSVFAGIGVAVLVLMFGVVLDYVITQILSQYFLRECSEDCYFQLFNAIFIVVAVLSIAGGVYAALRTHKRSSEKQ
jgi:hypothetical protein